MSDADRIASMLAEWQEKRDQGEDVDEEAILAAHPDLADQLREKLAGLKMLDATRVGTRVSPSATQLRELPLDRYADFRPTGEGGMGIVYWAIDTDLNREVAFKVVRPGVGEGDTRTPEAPVDLTAPAKDTPASQAFETLKQRFLQEAWVTGGLSHPGIVPVYELGQTPEGVPYYTMRFVKGERTLADAMEEANDEGIERRLKLLEPFLKVCDTLSYAHAKGVIHRDLKPDNIALGEFGEVVVIDWGLAKIADRPDVANDRWQDRIQEYREATDLRTVASAMGTPGYMAPEAAKGQADQMDARSDVYSLGVILFQILTGRLPFEFTTFGELVMKLLKEEPSQAAEVTEDVPSALSELCARCLAGDTEARPKDADEVAKAIRAWQSRSAVDREVEGLLRDATTSLEAAKKREGEARIEELDRVVASCSRVLTLRSKNTWALDLQSEVASLREQGVAEREKAARRRTLVRAGLVSLVMLIVGSAVAVLLIDSARRQEARARKRADRSEKAVTAQLRKTRAIALAAQSTIALESNAQLALLLAREALRVKPTSETRSSVLAALLAIQPLADRDPAKAMAFSADGRLVATVSEAGKLQVRSTRGNLVWETQLDPPEHGEGRWAALLLWSPDSRSLLSVGGGPARLWRLDGSQNVTYAGLTWWWYQPAPRFSPRGDHILSFAWGEGIAHLWDLTGRKRASIPFDTKAAEDRRLQGSLPAYSPDGKLLVHIEDKTAVVVRDLDTNVVRRLDTPGGEVEGFSFSSDSAFIATFAPSGSSFVWDLRTASRVATLAESGEPKIVSWAPVGGVHLISRDKGYDIRDMEATRTGRFVVETKDRADWGMSPSIVAWSPKGRHFLTWVNRGAGYQTTLWDIRGCPVRSVITGDTISAVPPSFSTDGQHLFVCDADLDLIRGAVIVDVTGHELGRLRIAHDGIHDMRWSADGRAIIFESDLQTAFPVLRPPLSRFSVQSNFYQSAISPHGDLIINGVQDLGDDGRPRIYDANGDLLGRLEATADGDWSVDGRLVDFSADGTRILKGGEEQYDGVVLHDRSGKALRRYRGGGEGDGEAVCVQLSRSDRYVVYAAQFVTRVWDIEGRLVATLRPEHQSADEAILETVAARVSPDDRHVVTATQGSIRIWTTEGQLLHDIPALPPEHPLRDEGGDIKDVQWLPDGERFVTLDELFGVRVWTVEGKPVAWFRSRLDDREAESNRSMACLPDGSGVVVQDQAAVRIHWLDGRPPVVLPGQLGGVGWNGVAVSPTGSHVAVGSVDNSVQLWTVEGEKTLTLPPSHRPLVHLRFTADDGKLVVVRQGEVLKVPVDRQAQIKLASRHCSRDFTEEERSRYRALLSPVVDR